MGRNTSLRGFACAQKRQLPVDVASLAAMMITIVLAKTLPDDPQASGPIMKTSARWWAIRLGTRPSSPSPSPKRLQCKCKTVPT